MKYYKTQTEIRAIEEGQEFLIESDWIEISLEEVEAINKPTEKQVLEQRIQEAKQYINDTGWIWEKYNRNVLALKDLTDEEFRLKYNDIINLQEEARLLINTLEIELNNLLGEN